MKQKIIKSMTMIVFIVLIFGVTIANLLTPDKSFSESENRYLEQNPEFTIDGLIDGSYAVKVEKYKTDQFIGRDEFIGVKTYTEYLMGKKDTSGVFFAADDYLIEKHENLDQNQIDKNIKYLVGFTDETVGLLGKSHVSVMIVPTASEVLSDKLPPLATSFDQGKLISDIKNSVGDVTFPDLNATLKENSSQDIYYKTDHHWTTLGAYYAYREWCDATSNEGHLIEEFDVEKVSDSFYGTVYSKANLPSTKPDEMFAFMPKFPVEYVVDYNMGDKITETLYDDEFLEKRDKYAYYLGGNHPIVEISSSNKNGKKMLLIKDSYGHSMAPFLANDFEEVHMLDLRYLNMSIQDYIKDNQITDVMVLYNTITFAKDSNIFKMTK